MQPEWLRKIPAAITCTCSGPVAFSLIIRKAKDVRIGYRTISPSRKGDGKCMKKSI